MCKKDSSYTTSYKSIPEAFQESLPIEPNRDERIKRDFVAAQQHIVAIPPRADIAPEPPMRMKSLQGAGPKVERDSAVHRSEIIVDVLIEVFGANWKDTPRFTTWFEQAKAISAQPLKGEAFANTPFMRLEDSIKVDGVLKRHRWGSLNWFILLGIVRGVFYCNEEERKQYLISFNAKICRGPKQEMYDTDELIKKLRDVGISPSSAGGFDKAHGLGCIWVVDNLDATASSVFYSHMCMMGRFHHSSFLSGKGIAAGGEWRIKSGKLIWISGESGHYKPEPWRFKKALEYLKKGNIDTSGYVGEDGKVEKCCVKLYEKGEGNKPAMIEFDEFVKDMYSSKYDNYLTYRP